MIKRAKFLVFSAIALGLLAVSWVLRAPERLVQRQPFTPDGLRVVLFANSGETNLVSFDPRKVSATQLDEFGIQLCKYSGTELTQTFSEIRESWLDRFRKHSRIGFVCF